MFCPCISTLSFTKRYVDLDIRRKRGIWSYYLQVVAQVTWKYSITSFNPNAISSNS